MQAREEPEGSSTVPTVRRLGPVPALDGLRGIAILLVIMSHSWMLVRPWRTGVDVIDRFVDGGYLGVDMFFVLSGFLITALLLSEQARHGSVRFWSFYGRRALRLLPALFFLLAVFAIYTLVADRPRRAAAETIGYAVVYLSNWQLVYDFPVPFTGMEHLWSLAIEEQFYLIWPAFLMLFLGLRRRASIVAAVLVTLIVAVAVHRAMIWEDTMALPLLARTTGLLRVSIGTDARMDSLLVGALVASLWVRGKTPTRGLTAAAWVAAGVLLLFVELTEPSDGFLYLGGLDLIAVATAVLILAAVDGRWVGNRLLELAPLRLVGRVSYGLYLWHFPIFWAVSRHADDQPRIVRIALGYGLTALFTAMSWMLVERPALRLKRRLERKQDVSVAPVSA